MKRAWSMKAFFPQPLHVWNESNCSPTVISVLQYVIFCFAGWVVLQNPCASLRFWSEWENRKRVEASRVGLCHWVAMKRTHAHTRYYVEYSQLPPCRVHPAWAPVVMHTVVGKYLVLQLSHICLKGCDWSLSHVWVVLIVTEQCSIANSEKAFCVLCSGPSNRWTWIAWQFELWHFGV